MIKNRIENKLQAAFAPDFLHVQDNSADHIGHAGYREGGNTHFLVVIRASAFDGMSALTRQRAVYKLLQAEFAAGMHALSLDIKGSAKK